MLLPERLRDYLLLDGGLATLIVAQGHECNEDVLWNARFLATDNSVISSAHSSFLSAGCDVIETATYQASITGFQQHLGVSEEEALALIRRGAELAIEARDQHVTRLKLTIDRQRPLVAGSAGPYGACLHDGSEYTGAYMDAISTRDLQSWHRPRIAALLEAGVDLLAFDTFPALGEALAVADLLETEFPAALAWISFSCRDGQHLNHGETLADAASMLLPYKQVFGVGINCTAPEYVSPLLESLPPEVKAGKTVLVYPNSGETWTSEKRWHGEPAQSLQSYVPQWIDAGARWIGGCCRVGPDQLEMILDAMADHLAKQAVNKGSSALQQTTTQHENIVDTLAKQSDDMDEYLTALEEEMEDYLANEKNRDTSSQKTDSTPSKKGVEADDSISESPQKSSKQD